MLGLGAYPAPHEQWLDMHGLRTANCAMDEADLIVAIGALSADPARQDRQLARALREIELRGLRHSG